jgi:phosphotransferase system enzyme I (PtsI)
VSEHVKAIGASPGRVMGPAHCLVWDVPRVAHRTIAPDEVEGELERFHSALERAAEGVERLRDETTEALGTLEANIFEPQLMMLEDPELVEGTTEYIRANHLSAARAFDWRMFEIRSQFLDTAHAMVVDRLADLRDVRFRVLSILLDLDERASVPVGERPHVLVADDLAPSIVVTLDRSRVLGLVTSAGSRGSHVAILARSLGIPAVMGVGQAVGRIEEGAQLAIDGNSGTLIIEPGAAELARFEADTARMSDRRRRIEELHDQPTMSRDGHRIRLLANLDRPSDAEGGRRAGAEGIGLFRTEFLVIAHTAIPSEEEQYSAYRSVVEAFPGREVVLRSFDLGGDKFPIFLQMPPEENPYLGWRAIRVCLDMPELFRNQLSAAVRAAQYGDLRLLLPMVVSVDEVSRTRELLLEVTRALGLGPEPTLPLGVMVETPAAVETVDLLCPHVDFFSLGTNDLTQYTLAADRGNSRLADIYDPLHPALIRMYDRVLETATAAGVPVSVCGALAADPAGVCVLLGLGYETLSVPIYSLPEVKELICAVSVGELAAMCEDSEQCDSPGEIRRQLQEYIEVCLSESGVAR